MTPELTYATSLLAYCPEVLNLDDPESVILRAKTYYRFSDKQCGQLMSAVALVTTDFFWSRLESFMMLSQTIQDGVVSNGVLPIPDIEDIGWAIVEAVLLTPDIKDCRFLDDQIPAYIELRAKEDGVMPFTLLRFLPEKSRGEWKDRTRPEVDNHIIIKMKNMIEQLQEVFKLRGKELGGFGEIDLEDRLALFMS